MFTTNFGRFACDGDTITCEVDGFICTATVYHDPDMGAPWVEHDGHGPVSDWTTRDKRPGERILSKDGRHRRFYDFQEAMRLALKDGWGVHPGPNEGETKRQYAARAVERDFANLKAWCDDEWTWCGVAVTISKNDIDLTDQYDHALWGIELNAGSDNDYLKEVANELLDDALDAAREALTELLGCED